MWSSTIICMFHRFTSTINANNIPDVSNKSPFTTRNRGRQVFNLMVCLLQQIYLIWASRKAGYILVLLTKDTD